MQLLHQEGTDSAFYVRLLKHQLLNTTLAPQTCSLLRQHTACAKVALQLRFAPALNAVKFVTF